MYEKIETLVKSQKFQNFIIILIILNGITMGLATSKEIMSNIGSLLELFDVIVITIFAIEIILRIYVFRLSFFKDPWSLFDFVIVSISLVPVTHGFEVFRTLRVLRLFRIITVVPQMRKIILALASVIPGMGAIAGLLVIFFYVFAVMATQLYAESFPQWFGSLGESFYTLFQIMTLESWSMGIVRPVMETHPYAWMFFVPFIFIVTFIMINLIVAVVVDAMNELNTENTSEIEREIHISEDARKLEFQKLSDEIQELKELIKSK
ncbi:MAG: ion transporter [Campylobacterota bacterium]|nr:ion transporter [Campylobacterota bacterium]